MNAKTKKFLSTLSHAELLELNLVIAKMIIAPPEPKTVTNTKTEPKNVAAQFNDENHPTRQKEFNEISFFFTDVMGWEIRLKPVINQPELTCWKVISRYQSVGLWLSPARGWSLEHIKFSATPRPFTGDFEGMDEQENFDIMLADAGIEIAE